jgi:Amt family ammonium transporter
VAVAALVMAIAAPAWAADPTGAATLQATPAAAVNFAWTLVAAALVFFMQAGFALLAAGLTRAKNTVNILTKSYMDVCIGGLAFWAFGFALLMGGSGLAPGLEAGGALIGHSGFFLSGAAYDVSTMVLWIFHMVFAATAATIVAGAMAERTRLPAYLAYSFLVSAVVYPIYGHWMWGGGWLATLPFGAGARDFAGSGVVHTIGGVLGLVGAAMVGPRAGKFNADGSPNPIPGHNMAYVVTGTFILFFGWFGFNAGSTLAATDLRISVITVNTFLAGATGAVVALYLGLIRTGRGDLLAACNGSLAGLVAITAPCAYVAPWAAVLIGGTGALAMLWAAGFVERRLRVDDPVGGVAVHAGAGVWGLLAVGLFADGTYGGVRGLLFGDAGQFVAQVLAAAAAVGWALAAGAAMFGLIRLQIGLRVSAAEETTGLDLPEHGQAAYPGEQALPAGAPGS